MVTLGPVLAWANRAFPRDASNSLIRQVRLFVDMIFYIFSREGTILISSIAFSFFLSLFPIIVLILSLADILHLKDLRETTFEALAGFFPISQDFIVRNLRIYSRGLGTPQVISVGLIAWAGSTFFYALEAGFDSACRVKTFRHFVHSQVVGTAMAFLAGVLLVSAIWVLGLVDTMAADAEWVNRTAQSIITAVLSFVLVLSIFFTLYYYLPNRRQRAAVVLRTSIFSTVAWLATNWIFRTWSGSWSLQPIYGPFYVSMTLLLWAYASGSILIGGARLSTDGFFDHWLCRGRVLKRAIEAEVVDEGEASVPPTLNEPADSAPTHVRN